MKVLAALLAVACATSGCFSRRGQAAAFAVGEAAIACDWAMTAWMRHHPDYEELNPLLGPHPSGGAVAGAMVAALAVNTAIYLAPRSVVPNWLRAAWLPYVAVVEVANDAYFNPAGHGQCRP